MTDRRGVAEREGLASEIAKLREDYEQRLQVMENTVSMLQTSLLQLQVLFATKTVDRGSGPTDGNHD